MLGWTVAALGVLAQEPGIPSMDEEIADRDPPPQQAFEVKPPVRAPAQTKWQIEISAGYADWYLWRAAKLHVHSFAWGLVPRRDWLGKGMALRFGVQGYHGLGVDVRDNFGLTETERVTLTLVQAQVEFLFGNPDPRLVFVHGLIGGSIGAAILSGTCTSNQGECPGYESADGVVVASLRPLNAGVGTTFFVPAGRRAHPTVGLTFRTDPLSLLIAGGGYVIDLQATAGIRF